MKEFGLSRFNDEDIYEVFLYNKRGILKMEKGMDLEFKNKIMVMFIGYYKYLKGHI